MTDTSGKQRPAIMLKNNGTLFFLDTTLGVWFALFDGSCLTKALKRDSFPRRPGFRPRNDDEVVLPSSLSDFPGADTDAYLAPRYGYSDQWIADVKEYCDINTLPSCRSRHSHRLYMTCSPR